MGIRRTNLPVQLTSFVGRERELDEIAHLLRARSLVTLTGPGGTGKTRLALQVAAHAAQSTRADVYFIELASLNDPALVTHMVAHVLGVKEQPGQPLLESIRSFLKPRRVLLLLDNFEHLLAAAPMVADLLQAAPRLTVFATSRERLHLYGEQEYPLMPLAVPDLREQHALESVTRSEAGRLFVQRACAARPDFELKAENAFAVAEICNLLEGLPLAIELAAARVKLFSAQALLLRLQGTVGHRSATRLLELLTGGARDRPPRQQTLRSTIDWSYQLLPPEERRLFRRLATFTGGMTLDATAAVADHDGDLGIDVLDGIAALVNKSLLRQERGDTGEARFVMLQTVQEFALERLEASGEAERIRRYHAEHYRALAETAARHLRGREQGAWLQRLEKEQSNFRAVLLRCEQACAVELGLRLTVALWPSWYMRGQASEGLRWLVVVLAWTETNDYSALRARALCGAGALTTQRGDYAAAQAYSQESLALARPLGDKWSVAIALINLAAVARYKSDYAAARAHAEEALATARELGEKATIAIALVNLGVVAKYQRDDVLAHACSTESLTLARELGDLWTAAIALTNLGTVARYAGDYQAARSYYEEALDIARGLGDKWVMAIALPYLGVVATAEKKYGLARALFRENLTMQREVGLKREIATVLGDLAALEAAEGYALRAARLWGAAEALRERINASVSPTEARRYERALDTARERLGEERFAAALTEGQLMDLEDAMDYAFAEPTPEERTPSREGQQGLPADLTPREVEVLCLVAEGLKDAEVAEALVISPRTVNAHLTSIYRKLDVRSRAAATRFAIEQGLLSN